MNKEKIKIGLKATEQLFDLLHLKNDRIKKSLTKIVSSGINSSTQKFTISRTAIPRESSDSTKYCLLFHIVNISSTIMHHCYIICTENVDGSVECDIDYSIGGSVISEVWLHTQISNLINTDTKFISLVTSYIQIQKMLKLAKSKIELYEDIIDILK